MYWGQVPSALMVSNYLILLVHDFTLHPTFDDMSAEGRKVNLQMMWKFYRAMTRPFFTHDRISHCNIFDRHAECAINLI